MARLANGLVLAALAAVVLVAALDALPRPRPAPPAEALAAAGVRGTLTYSDPECRRRRLDLPTLAARDVGITGCAVYGRAGSLGILRGAVVWHAFAGGTTTVLPRAPGRDVRRVAWLGNVRFAAAVRRGGRAELALYERDRLVRVLVRAERIRDVRASAGGSFLAAVADGRVLLFDRGGRAVELPAAARRGRALAWSPDERRVAVAAPGAIVFAEPGGDVLARIAVDALDVDWR